MLDIKENVKKNMKYEDMLKNDNNFGDDTVLAYLSNQIHPQKDNNTKWKLGKLFNNVALKPPKYYEKL